MADKITPDTIATIQSEMRKKVGIYTDEDIQGVKTFKEKQVFEKGFSINNSEFDNSNIALKSETNALEIKLSEGKNYIKVLAVGTAAENFAELQAKYDLLKAYKDVWSNTTAYAINEIVLSGGLYYKRKTVGSSFSFPNPSGTQEYTAYWQYIEQQADSPFEGIYELDNDGPKDMVLNEYVQMYVEEYDETEELVFAGYNKYKCIQAITFPVSPDLDIVNWELYTDRVYLTPSASNRYTLLLPPGYYTGTFVANQQYVNIVSLTGNRDINISGFEALANNVYIKGIVTTSTRFTLGNNLSTLIVENCLSVQSYSFCVGANSPAGTNNIISGTFIDCEGDNSSNQYNSFGCGEKPNGTFIRCIGSRIATKSSSTGIWIDCVSSYGYSFGYTTSSTTESIYCNANGTYYRCISKMNNAFGTQCNGKYYYCVVEGGFGFGTVNGTPEILVKSTGEFYYCISKECSFCGTSTNTPSGNLGNVLFIGKAIGCVGGWGSYGGITTDGGVDGTLINCIINTNAVSVGLDGALPYFKTVKARACTISVGVGALITKTGHGKVKGNIVRFTTTDTLPAGLAIDTDYFIIESGLTVDAFKVSATPNGTAIETTDAGIGTHSVILGQYINCIDGTGALINSNS
jgi:hypothetical protein